MRLPVVQISTLTRQFDINLEEPEISEDELLEILTKIIKQYLDRELDKLLNILYRIDVDEEDIRQILTSDPPDQIARSLAIKIIAREKKKIRSRKNFRS